MGLYMLIREVVTADQWLELEPELDQHSSPSDKARGAHRRPGAAVGAGSTARVTKSLSISIIGNRPPGTRPRITQFSKQIIQRLFFVFGLFAFYFLFKQGRDARENRVRAS